MSVKMEQDKESAEAANCQAGFTEIAAVFGDPRARIPPRR
jgi:hypothetical protein